MSGGRNQEQRWRQVEKGMEFLKAPNLNQALIIQQKEEKLKLNTNNNMKPLENH